MPSNTSILVERVPIEFADFTFKVVVPSQNAGYNANLYPNMAQVQNPDIQAKGPGVSTTDGYPKPSGVSQPTISGQTMQARNPREGEMQVDASQMQGQHRDLAASSQQRAFFNPQDQFAQGAKLDQPEPVFTPEEWEKALESARFFVIRSSNPENIHISRQHNEWATTRSNEGKLNEAFNSSRFVFLIFAVSKTYHFHGVALMMSATSNKGGNFWKNTDTIKLGGCFKVKWITYSLLSFNRISNLTNPYCDNEPVKKSRDCTEIEPKVGKELCLYFDMIFRDRSQPNPLPPFFFNNFKMPGDPQALLNRTTPLIEGGLAGDSAFSKFPGLFHPIKDMPKQESLTKPPLIPSHIPPNEAKDTKASSMLGAQKTGVDGQTTVQSQSTAQPTQENISDILKKAFGDLSEKELQKKLQEVLNQDKDKDKRKQDDKKKPKRTEKSSESDRSESRKKHRKRKRYESSSSESRDRHHRSKNKNKRR